MGTRVGENIPQKDTVVMTCRIMWGPREMMSHHTDWARVGWVPDSGGDDEVVKKL